MPLLLTRPIAASERLAREIRARHDGPIEIVISPLFEIVAVAPPPTPNTPRAVLLTSENGARRAGELGYAGRAFCVGARTAQVARKLGFDAVSADGTVEDLLELLRHEARPQDGDPRPLLHLRGAATRGNLAERLTATGIPAQESIVYEQRPRPLSSAARALLGGEAAVVIPLYSPASAGQFARELADLGGNGATRLTIAISAATAQSLGECAGPIHVAASPTGAAMRAAILETLARTAEQQTPPVTGQPTNKGDRVAKPRKPKDDTSKNTAPESPETDKIEDAEVIAESPAPEAETAPPESDETAPSDDGARPDDGIESAPDASASESDTGHDDISGTPVSEAPQPSDARNGPGAGMLLLGGLVAGGIGYGAARFTQPEVDFSPVTQEIAALKDDLARVEGTIPAAPDLSPIESTITAAQGRIDALDGTLSGLDGRVAELESRPVLPAPVDGEDLSPYAAQLQALQSEISAQSTQLSALTQDAQARIAALEGKAATVADVSAELQAEADAARQAAEAATREARMRQLLGTIDTALTKGEAYAAPLAELAELSDIPEGLAASAETGVAPLGALVEALPDNARTALRAARDAGVSGDEAGSRLTAFFKKQLDIRSTTPRDGDSPDAVLSRLEAAVKAGDLGTALGEYDALPEPAQQALSGWSDDLRARHAALQGAADISNRLTEK